MILGLPMHPAPKSEASETISVVPDDEQCAIRLVAGSLFEVHRCYWRTWILEAGEGGGSSYISPVANLLCKGVEAALAANLMWSATGIVLRRILPLL